jgi:hypothetical protein
VVKRISETQKIRQKERISSPSFGNRQPRSKEFAVNRKTHKRFRFLDAKQRRQVDDQLKQLEALGIKRVV